MKEAIQKAVLPEIPATAIRPRSQWGTVHGEFKELKVHLSEKERIQLQRLSDLLSHALGTTEPSAVIGRMLEEALEKHDPVRIEARREKVRKERAEKKKEKESEAELFSKTTHDAVSNRGEVDLSKVQRLTLQNDANHGGAESHRKTTPPQTVSSPDEVALRNNEPISVPLKRQVHVRDGHEGCHNPGPDGKKCSATRFLDIDHIIPRAQCGPNTWMES